MIPAQAFLIRDKGLRMKLPYSFYNLITDETRKVIIGANNAIVEEEKHSWKARSSDVGDWPTMNVTYLLAHFDGKPCCSVLKGAANHCDIDVYKYLCIICMCILARWIYWEYAITNKLFQNQRFEKRLDSYVISSRF